MRKKGGCQIYCVNGLELQLHSVAKIDGKRDCLIFCVNSLESQRHPVAKIDGELV